ncbi:hypothetical protein CAEBREN_04119 [Caenorhabditis brenneri]|uniref:S phase cyclin A-associated protein in the endoplasmic reticulum N-terminal domain-containing protein n=1 Tax=Caenorhabditis brenneri TaxID=135651 RepID=G0P1Z9_CAEBE|nr:hypothetical protein CAEBREN_04119 [Caenorhabditis brenneri]
MATIDREKAESVVSRSSKKKKNRKKRARQWTGYVESLKTNIDMMYEMCRSEQSVAGCREAMLYLQSASNDFKSLIETINVEKQWDQDENNPQQDTIKRPSVAWEVRKSMSSPNPAAVPISTIIAEAIKNVSPPTKKSEGDFNQPTSTSAQSTLTYARITAAAAVAAVAVSSSNNQTDDGWKVVTSRRRKSTSSTTVSEFDREFSVEKEMEKDRKSENSEPLNVYERLSSTSYRRGPPTTNRTLTCPKSAMDLPQTRASMAKMAYSRQLLWEKNQQVLVEKLRQKQKKEKIGRSGSQCGFTFADPLAVRKSVEAFNQQKIGGRRAGKETSSTSSNIELQSINEESPTNPASENSEDVPADPAPSDPPGSLFGYVQVPEDIEKDQEWREMTEEEESLALEENSLKLEIKQAESMEIDAELERQVEMEADILEREHRAQRRTQRKEEEKQEKNKKQEEMENFFKVFEELRTQAWSELMEQECNAAQHPQKTLLSNVHEPGTPVERHEKMLSPSRRRCQKDDDDFGKRHEMKQKHAEELRQQLQEAKALKLKELTSRVEEVRAKQEALKERKRQLLEARMQRASDNRDKNIMEVIRRAKDDDQRVMEVKFIATLQEDNKRYELRAKDASVEEKQKQLADERARKNEEKAQKKREQEAAATARRVQAAEARQEKIRQLNEQKEQRARKQGIPNPNAPEDMLLYLKSLVAGPEPTETPLPYLWPSSTPSEPRECTLCPSTVVRSDLEAVSHVVCSKEHQNQVKMLTSGSQVEVLKKHLFTVFKEATVIQEEGKEQKERDEKEAKQMKERENLEKIQLTETLPGPCASPRNRTKYIREFNLAIDKFSSKDEKQQELLEKSLADLVTAIESDQKTPDATTNIDQFCGIQGPQKLVDALLEWTKNGASLRLCIRICHAFCIFLKDPKVSYSVIFKPELLKLVEKILELLASEGDQKAPQLSALLDVLATCLKTANHRTAHPHLKQSKKEQRDNKELQKLDCHVAGAISSIGTYFDASLNLQDIKNGIHGSRGPVLLATRLLGLAEQTTPEFLKKMSSAVLEHTYNCRKTLENRKENSKSAQDLVQMSISLFSRNEKIMESCFKKNPVNLLMWVVLMEDAMWKCLENIKKQENPVERSWGSLTKDEETLCKLCQQLGNVVECMEQWEKRCTMISWTSGQASCLNILLQRIPNRLLAIGKHSSRIVPTVTKIMDRLTNSEKSEMLGDTSADWFFQNSLFPGRVLE